MLLEAERGQEGLHLSVPGGAHVHVPVFSVPAVLSVCPAVRTRVRALLAPARDESQLTCTFWQSK